MTIYDLNDTQLAVAFQESHRRICSLLERPGCTYAALAAQIGIGESALKQFVRRGIERGQQALRRGSAFDRIYRFVTTKSASEFQSIPAGQLPVSRELSDTQKCDIYGSLMRILGVRPHALTVSSEKVFEKEKFVCFRNAINKDLAVVSEIIFSRLSEDDPVWEFEHYYLDSDGVEKRSDGMALVINKTIYLLGDIQRGEGLDIFLIREPMGAAQYLMGFLVSMADDHRPFFANIVLVDAKALGDDKVEYGIIRKQELINFTIPANQHFGRQLTNCLNVDASESVLRIKKSYLVPGLLSEAEAS